MQLGLVYGKKPNKSPSRDSLLYGLIEYANSNFAGDLEDRKSVMGHFFFLNRAVVL